MTCSTSDDVGILPRRASLSGPPETDFRSALSASEIEPDQTVACILREVNGLRFDGITERPRTGSKTTKPTHREPEFNPTGRTALCAALISLFFDHAAYCRNHDAVGTKIQSELDQLITIPEQFPTQSPRSNRSAIEILPKQQRVHPYQLRNSDTCIFAYRFSSIVGGRSMDGSISRLPTEVKLTLIRLFSILLKRLCRIQNFLRSSLPHRVITLCIFYTHFRIHMWLSEDLKIRHAVTKLRTVRSIRPYSVIIIIIKDSNISVDTDTLPYNHESLEVPVFSVTGFATFLNAVINQLRCYGSENGRVLQVEDYYYYSRILFIFSSRNLPLSLSAKGGTDQTYQILVESVLNCAHGLCDYPSSQAVNNKGFSEPGKANRFPLWDGTSFNMSLENFVQEHDFDFSLKTVDEEQKELILRRCLDVLKSGEETELVKCLSCLRILSRDERCLDQLKDENVIDRLLSCAFPSGEILNELQAVEALKTLSNLLFKRPSILNHLKSADVIQKLVSRLKTHRDTVSRSDLLQLDLKLLFLLSGLDPTVRQELVDRNEVFSLLADLLCTFQSVPLSTKDYQLISDIFKVAFLFLFLIFFSRWLIILDIPSNAVQPICSQLVNFLNVMPRRSFKLLISMKGGAAVQEMTSIQVLLDFLDTELVPVSAPCYIPQPGLEETLCPVLNALTRAAQGNRDIRKYCRAKVLPHLRAEVRNLPEEGATMRNRLCKLLTNPSHGVSELVALFLFVLCKEDIGRAVKYTGFGNFAGFLARHALLGGASKKSARSKAEQIAVENSQGATTAVEEDSAQEYSSASSDSETEEYKRLKDEVNPVTGRWEASRADPMEGMSEEQKEYFAMELVNNIDKLQRGGVIQPGRVGEDGRVKPVSHVLELLETAKTVQKEEDSSDSD
ncbi:synembryn-A [Clonorchis sinensis]|uniref:Synembryn-A n=1 Tax=Clonorchis sinensis TaxID=79923 RepID=G7YK78_CLOSI|nr:synembryn-A [Clonorchis sinensis]